VIKKGAIRRAKRIYVYNHHKRHREGISINPEKVESKGEGKKKRGRGGSVEGEKKRGFLYPRVQGNRRRGCSDGRFSLNYKKYIRGKTHSGVEVPDIRPGVRYRLKKAVREKGREALKRQVGWTWLGRDQHKKVGKKDAKSRANVRSNQKRKIFLPQNSDGPQNNVEMGRAAIEE